jgi:hypothetical protein
VRAGAFFVPCFGAPTSNCAWSLSTRTESFFGWPPTTTERSNVVPVLTGSLSGQLTFRTPPFAEILAQHLLYSGLYRVLVEHVTAESAEQPGTAAQAPKPP